MNLRGNRSGAKPVWWSVFAFAATVTGAQAVLPPVPADWIEVAAGKTFTLRAPPGTQFHQEQGIDSTVGGFTGPGFTMDFDFGIYSPTLEDLRDDPEYTAEAALVDGKPALFVSGPARNAFGCKQWLVAVHTAGAGSGMFDRENTLTMGACVKDTTSAQMIEAIFRTIKFSH